MAYKVKTISAFERQAKRLIKKYHSLQKELLNLVKELKENPEQGTSLEIIATKSGYQSLQKEKANQEGQGSLPTL